MSKIKNPIIDDAMSSVYQTISDEKNREYKQRKRDADTVREMDNAIASDPEQMQWEKEHGLNRVAVRRDEYEIVIPDAVRIVGKPKQRSLYARKNTAQTLERLANA